jgi:hypothetical protein
MPPTLLDIAKLNGSDALVGLVDEASQAMPELTLAPARTISGLNYKTLIRTAVPRGGSFRDANEGVAPVVGTYENRMVETFIFDKRWQADKAVADRYEDGAAAFIALEASAIVQGGFQDLAQQFYYGRNATFGNAKGYPGLIDAYDATNMVVDAGGTTDATASSVWLVKFGPKNIQWVWGNGGEMAMSDPRIETITPDPTNNPTKKMDGYVQTLLAYPGLQVASRYSAVRIKKITEDAGKGLTDELIYEALAKFPAGIVPDVMLMTRRSREQLRASRTAVNATGAPAPTPTEVGGIPISVTDAISNVETLTL